MRERFLPRIAPFALLVLPLTYAIAPTLPLPPLPREILRQVAWVLPFAISTVLAIVARRRSRGIERRFWSYLVIACSLLFVNEAYVAVRIVLQLPVLLAISGIALIFGFSAAGSFMALLLSMTRVAYSSAHSRARLAIECAVAFLLGWSLSYMLVAVPYLRPLGAPEVDIAAAAGYSVAGAIVLVGTFTNLFGWRVVKWREWEAQLAAGITLYALGVLIWPLWLASTYYVGGPGAIVVEMLWGVGQVTIVVGEIRRLTAGEEGGPQEGGLAPAARPGRPLLMPIVTLLTAVAVLLLHKETSTMSAAHAAFVALLAFALVVRSALVAHEVHIESRRRALDALTGLEGHRRLRERLDAVLADSERAGEPVSLVVFDLDDLARVNESRGRREGDRRLVAVARTLEGMIGGETLYRAEEDAFAVVFPRLDAEAALRTALRARWEAERALAEDPPVTLSAGIASFPAHATGTEQLLRLACQAAHEARASGPEHVLIYRSEGADASVREAAYVRMLQRLARTADEREGVAAHGSEVAALATVLARRMLLAEDRVALVSLAAELHDIGKIALRDSGQGSGGTSGDSTWHEHSIVGGRMLSCDRLRELAPWVVAHHEAWNGSGSPRGLAGEAIPLEARIIAVCDAYDRIRRIHGEEEALAVLGQERGRLFDPVLVEQFFYAISDMRSPRGQAAEA